jgi:hypothetical protein
LVYNNLKLIRIMLRKIIILLLVPVFLGVFSSCEDELSKVPKDLLVADIALVTVNDYQSQLFSAYKRVNDFNYYGQQMMVGPEILADNLKLINRTGRYEGEEVNSIGAGITIWDRYTMINECNFVINDIADATGDAVLKNTVKGEALFLRALAYHDLLRAFAYEPGRFVNGFNTGVIMRTTPTRSAPDADLRARGTVEEGYTLIEQDLLEAITLLTANPPTAFPFRANAAAARALLARVYLYAGRYPEAAIQADAALAGTTATLSTAAGYAAIWNTPINSESLFESEIRLANWSTVDGVNNSLNSLSMNTFPSAQFILAASDDLIATFETGDVRRTLWEPGPDGSFTGRKWRGEKGVFLENIPIIRYSEVLLIAAEGKARSANEAGARINLTTLRTNRGLASVADDVTGQALINLILKERRLELCLEGHRYFDLKRLGLNITKPAPRPVVQASDFRIIARLPVGEVQLNPNLVQNPGY